MRKHLYVGATAAGLAWGLPALAPLVPPLAGALRVPRRIDAPGAVAITFDDGPDPLGTSAVLEALRRADAKATFFLVGEQVEKHPALAAEIAAAGHSVACHGHRHRNLLRLGPRQFAEDLDRGVTAVGEATGVEATHYRPPFGVFNPLALRITRQAGLQPLLWSRWGHDWRARANAETIAAEITSSELGAGDVVLLHDADHYSAPGCWRDTAAAIPAVVEAVRAAGLRAATIGPV